MSKLLLALTYAACYFSGAIANAAPGQVYVNLFEWKYTDIQQECVQHLRPAGFSAVQISVPSEAKQNTRQWWERYQPASYRIDNTRLGTRQQLADMINTCRSVGIAIYADVILNHMGNGSGTGESGSFYDGGNYYPSTGFTRDDFHQQCTIDEHNSMSIHDCWLGGDLPDLRTDSPKVRQIAANYLRELLSLGIAGFRIDAAKHIPANDLREILNLAGNVNYATGSAFGLTRPWVTGEAFAGFGPISENERSAYFSLGSINEFKYKDIMRDTFTRNGASISQLAYMLPPRDGSSNPRGLFASRNATVFVSNHDLERHNESLTSRNSNKLFNLANIFMLAYPYGQTQLQSGYKLWGNPNDDLTLVPAGPIYNNGVPNFSEWDQQHRWREISNMVEFRNQTQSRWQVDDWTTDGGDRIAFHRGDRGFLAINRDDYNSWVRTFYTGMAPGQYCNVINGLANASKSECSGDVITVNADSTVNLNISSMNAMGIPAVAIHAGQKLAPRPTSSDITPPSAPTNIKFESTTSTGLIIRWKASTDIAPGNGRSSGIKGYRVRRNGGAPVFTKLTTLTDSTLKANTNYTYTISAIDNAGNESVATTAQFNVCGEKPTRVNCLK